jgi:hypothetical protein
MGVYRRQDSTTYWMSLVINGKRERQDTGVQNRRVAEEIFAAWQVKVARDRWLGTPAPIPTHSVQELVAEYLATRDTTQVSRFATSGSRGVGGIPETLGRVGLGPTTHEDGRGLSHGALAPRDLGHGE